MLYSKRVKKTLERKIKIMAKITLAEYKSKSRKRKGIHCKTKSSKVKNSKNYLKRYRGQGR
ncbi:MAG: hypothetical protein GOVbin3009_27 [Prokaryotic dsDNA virus sp.]|nr:MAG: hypothetical protein GOVbin3009_27 [Prokaryotic dsDNA virus sp.]